MKPDGGLSPGDMEDLGMEPSKFFCELGLLIIESRVPELSTRGRTEGPHCPADIGHLPCLKHDCDSHNSRCKRTEVRQKQMNLLWCNKIPMCIEVLLFPDCQHGCEKANNTDVSMPDALTDSLLLEQWTIQVIPKRCVERLVSPQVLFQAVKSYLYFSQLSAWLNSTHGTAPRTIAYRISPPGEFCTSTFSESPEWHEFPVCCLLKSVAVKISLAVVPRRASMPQVVCSHPQHRGTTETDNGHSTTCKQATAAKMQAVASCSDGLIEGTTAHLHTTQARIVGLQTSTPQPATGAIPKLCHHMPPFQDCRQQTSPETCENSVLESSSRKLEPSSRKVLYTKRSEGAQAYYPKDHSRTTSPDIDCLVNKTLGSSTELQPLSPTDMQLYLLSLGGTGHDRPETKQGGHNNMHLAIGKQANRTNLLRAFTDSVDRDSLETFPSLKSMPPSLVQQQCQQQQQQRRQWQHKQQQQLQKLQQHSTAKALNVLSIKDCDAQTFHKDETDTFHRGDADVFHNGDAQVFHKGDTQVFHKGDMQVFHKGDTQVFHKDDTQVLRKGGQSPRSKNDMISLNRDDSKDPSTDTTSDVTFSVGDNEPVTDLNGTAHNSLFQCDTSPSPARGGDSGNTVFRRPCSTSSRRPFHKSVSMPTYNAAKFPGFNKVSCLLRSVIRKELMSEAGQVRQCNQDGVSGHGVSSSMPVSNGRHVPSQQDRNHFQEVVNLSSKLMFRCGVATPLQSSPAPIKKKTSGCFDFDSSLTSARAIKNSISCVNLDKHDMHIQDNSDDGHFYSVSAPASTNSLLGNFEESLLNGRIEPAGVVEGFTTDIGASGDFCPKHVQADVTAFFFSLSDDNAPSPYLGHISLDCAGRRGYHVPRHGTVQVTLFNPNKTVVKMFVVMYNLSDMPPNSQTFLRQRTLYTPIKGSAGDMPNAPSYLRYLIHLRFMSSRTGKIYLHTDIRLIFARDKFEYDSRVANYELRSFTEGPRNPEFSPKS